MTDNVESSIKKLYLYCKDQDWSGYDPYDALNSPYLKKLSNKWARMFVTQILRRFPINLRVQLKIAKGPNPKALALFLRSLIRLKASIPLENSEKELDIIIERLLELKSDNLMPAGTIAWGYNFGWQSRVFYCERFSPNIQSTIMGSHAFFELSRDEFFDEGRRIKYKNICAETNRFILENFLMYENEEFAILRYIPNDDSIIYNVQAQAAWSFLRAYLITENERYRDLSIKLTKYVEQKQQSDGSWLYGEDISQRFIDNFHTGFILEALYECRALDRACVSEDVLYRGYKYYLDHFFKKDGSVSYFHNKTLPVDSHAIALSIITLSKLAQYEKRSESILNNVITWVLENIQSKDGYFYYQKWPMFLNKIPYMRWTQAWMLYALAIYTEREKAAPCVV